MPTSRCGTVPVPRCAASLAVFRGDSLLLVERGRGPLQGRWSLPGGHIEAGERARAAALRETREETGVAADLIGLVDVHEVIINDASGTCTAHYLIAVFCGRWRAGEPVAGGDAARARFVPVAELARYPLSQGLIPLVHRAWELMGGCAEGVEEQGDGSRG
jgi:8-oxo-dGTP diphosphatase